MDSPEPARKAGPARAAGGPAATTPPPASADPALADARFRDLPDAEREPAPVTAGVGRPTLLLVEDEPMVRKLVCATLEAAGFEVLAASDGNEALQQARRETLHLLVTDVVMPGMSGPEVAARVRELHPRVRVLYISGYTDESIAHEGGEPGTVGFLQKPFAPDVLVRRVREMLGITPVV